MDLMEVQCWNDHCKDTTEVKISRDIDAYLWQVKQAVSNTGDWFLLKTLTP
jgi:hypothetical protein